MITWWLIVFSSGPSGSGYMKMQDGSCLGIYLEDGTDVLLEGTIEYTCVQTDGVAPPPWA